MIVLILIACFAALPLGVLVGYRAGKGAAFDEMAKRQAAYAEELRERWERNSQVLKARAPRPTHLH